MKTLALVEQPLSLGQQIGNMIEKDIMQSRLKPVEPITEQHLAATYSVSRGPIREALCLLKKEGVVQMLPRRGARVTQLSVAEIREIFVTRSNFFGLAARLFCGGTQPHNVQVLAGLHSQMKALGLEQSAQHAAVSAQMGLVMIEHCGNDRLQAMILPLAPQVTRYTQLGLRTPRLRRLSISSWRTCAAATISTSRFLRLRLRALHVLTPTRPS